MSFEKMVDMARESFGGIVGDEDLLGGDLRRGRGAAAAVAATARAAVGDAAAGEAASGEAAAGEAAAMIPSSAQIADKEIIAIDRHPTIIAGFVDFLVAHCALAKFVLLDASTITVGAGVLWKNRRHWGERESFGRVEGAGGSDPKATLGKLQQKDK